MNTPFTITSIVAYDLPKSRLVDFVWACTSFDEKDELVLFGGRTRRLSETEWSSEAEQLGADPWRVDATQDECRRSRAGDAAAFVSERLRDHFCGRDAGLAAVIHTVTENTTHLTMSVLPGAKARTVALRRVPSSAT